MHYRINLFYVLQENVYGGFVGVYDYIRQDLFQVLPSDILRRENSYQCCSFPWCLPSKIRQGVTKVPVRASSASPPHTHQVKTAL